MVYIGYIFIPWPVLHQPHTAWMHLRAVGEYAAAARYVGYQRFSLPTFMYSSWMMAGLAGATISLSISPVDGFQR